MNMNDTVRVTLTEAGKRCAVEWGRGLGVKAGFEMSDRERAGEWQLWRLMQVFGAAMYNGMPEALFEKNEVLFGGLNDLRDRVHNLAIEKGWYEGTIIGDPEGVAVKLCLIHSEVSEAVESVRRNQIAADTWVPGGKPIGLPSELADIIIRTLDLCGALGIDIERAVETKHAYNCTRSHRHGGKAL